MTALRLLTPAKINLSLRVLGRRPDGYHEVATVLQAVDLWDVLELRLRPGPISVETLGADFDIAQEENLVWRAMAAYLDRLGRPREGVGATLTKEIPSGAGLGGGSSDAAAALRGLAALVPGPTRREELLEIAGGLGADVPFFLGPSPALGIGRGDRLAALESLGAVWYVLAKPPFSVSTAEAYRALALTAPPEAHSIPRFGPAGWAEAVREGNDLEGPVVRKHPEIGGLKAQLLEAGARAASMSGSGSAVFGVFTDENAAVAAGSRLLRSASCWVRVVRPVDGDPLQRWRGGDH